MNLSQIAVAAGTDVKWLQNASAILKRPIRRNIDDTRMWALIRALTRDLKIPLTTSLEIGTAALSDNRGHRVPAGLAGAGIASVAIDLSRFDSVFYANLSRARTLETPKRRGRPIQRKGDALARAKAYGIDVSLLEAALNRSVSECLERLNANSEFLRELRRVR